MRPTLEPPQCRVSTTERRRLGWTTFNPAPVEHVDSLDKSTATSGGLQNSWQPFEAGAEAQQHQVDFNSLSLICVHRSPRSLCVIVKSVILLFGSAA